MNDDEIKSALGELDRGVELDPRRAAAIRSAMVDALHEADGEAVAQVLRVDPGSRRRWSVFAAAAAALSLLVAGLVVVAGPDEPETMTSEVPEVGNYLVACVEFQTATRVGEGSWIDVLSEVERRDAYDDEYRHSLGDALEALAGEVGSEPLASDLRQAASGSRDGAPLEELIAQLRDIEQQSLRANGLICLR